MRKDAPLRLRAGNDPPNTVRDMARINLHLSDDLHAVVIIEAEKAGVRHTDWVREAIALRIGRLRATDDLARHTAAIADLATRVEGIEHHLGL